MSSSSSSSKRPAPSSTGSASNGKRSKGGSDSGAADELRYEPGFGNNVSSEALEGALPKGQNNPQKVRRACFCGEGEGGRPLYDLGGTLSKEHVSHS